MKQKIILSILPIFFIACSNTSEVDSQQNTIQKASYLSSIEDENNISYEDVKNTYGSYITSMCYTKTEDNSTGIISNPCYSCHTKGEEPNYYNDTILQKEYNFPPEIMTNRFSNLFKDRTEAVEKISDGEILSYIRESNYFDENGSIILQDNLPQDWNGYKPDCYFNFDEDGFDKDTNNNYTLWRAFRYYPFLGTFWPTNGSTDDVLIRLDELFTQTQDAVFDLEVYKINLAIVESTVKQKDMNLGFEIEESKYGVDLNQNGILDFSSIIATANYTQLSYVGKAKELLEKGDINIALGLFPVNTEFLHTVRYVDWDESANHIKMSKRLKELRYAKKYTWKNYSELERIAQSELNEALATGNEQGVLANFRGDYENGMNNDIGWIYQGFIESKDGELRPQTHEETIACMGCHSHLGATTDSIFAFARKLEGVDKNSTDFGWNHWTQKGLVGVKEPQVQYQNYDMQYEYSFYLKNNNSANEFRDNDEVKTKFFNEDGTIKEDMLENLHNDISELLFPSYERALNLNKGYKTMVNEQSYIYGRDANVKPMINVFKEINIEQTTNIVDGIVR